MGVGYPLDLVVCVALGVDMFDCVYPTRTARFGVAFVPSGTLRLKSKECGNDLSRIHSACRCTTCQHFTRASLHMMFKENNPMASQLLTKHNIYYMMTLMRSMRQVRKFCKKKTVLLSFSPHKPSCSYTLLCSVVIGDHCWR
jgi:queuine tRNA-ribosyltransferase